MSTPIAAPARLCQVLHSDSLPLLCKPPSCSAQPTSGRQLIGLVSVPVTAQQLVVPWG